MATYSGINTVIGFGAEGSSTWGTAVSRTNWLGCVSTALNRSVTRSPTSSLKASTSSAMRRTHFTGSEEAGGSVTVLASYDSMGLLVKHALGAVATTGSDPYTHAYTLASTLPSLTVEEIRGNSGQSEVYEGMVVSSATFECSAASEMTLALDFIGETASTRGSAGTPSYGTGTTVLHHHAGTMSIAGNAYSLSSFSLTLNNNISRRQFLGSKLTAEPLRSDFSTVECSLTVDASDQLYTDLHADTQADATITFTSGALSIEFVIQNAYISSASDPISGAGVITQSVVLQGESDGTDEGLKISITNGHSTAVNN